MKRVGRSAARVFEQLVVHGPQKMRQIVDDTRRCRYFPVSQPEAKGISMLAAWAVTVVTALVYARGGMVQMVALAVAITNKWP